MVEKKSTKNTSRKRQSANSKLPFSAIKKLREVLKRTKSSLKTNKTRRQQKNKKQSVKPRRTIIPVSKNLQLELRLAKRRPVTKAKKSKLKTPVRSLRQKLTPPWSLQKSIAASLAILGLGGVLYFGAVLLSPQPEEEVYSPPTFMANRTSLDASAKENPLSLVIPDISLATQLISVGRQADSTMEVPKSYDIAAWYKFSPVPGDIGPAVLVGHVDSYKGPAIFWRLRELQPGQLIYVKRADNKTVKFKVTNVEQFSQDKFPSQKVYGDIDFAGLRLITCGGTFNRNIGQYSHNTVVFATMVL